MNKYSGVAEIVGAITILAVSAIAAGTILIIHTQTQDSIEDDLESYLELSYKKASELVSISTKNTICNDDTTDQIKLVLHNYAKDNHIDTKKMTYYLLYNNENNDNEENKKIESITNENINFEKFNGTNITIVKSKSSAILTIEGNNICYDNDTKKKNLLIIMPSQDYLVVDND